jgi:hypothetical protein
VRAGQRSARGNDLTHDRLWSGSPFTLTWTWIVTWKAVSVLRTTQSVSTFVTLSRRTNWWR